METKICSHCKRELPLTMFHKRSSAEDGLQKQCKDCMREYNRQWASKQRASVVTVGGGKQPPFPDADFDNKEPREVLDIMSRAKRWLEERGYNITLRGTYTQVREIKF